MNFERETSRSEKITALDLAFSRYKDLLEESSDALFTDSKRDKIIIFTGMKYYAPICMHIINDEKIYAFIANYENDLLFKKSADLSFYVDGKIAKLPDDIKERVEEIYERIFSSPGYINENGEHVIDLKSYSIGTHYNVNLLLGDRNSYDDCLQSTPKSVLDCFGRGSFRGRQEKQVLATRYVLSPEENGEPANRQFYITENGKQIFYSLDVENNVKSAYCIHSQNHTVITYETNCGLKIIRTIFLLPQEENEPNAVEAQRITIENLSGRKRDLRIIVTGMFGITDPGTLSGDIIFANVVVESEIIYKNKKPIALSAHHQPKECDSEKRFAMLLVQGETMDEYCSYLPDFIGDGTLSRPEMIARLSNKHSRRQAAFFAMGKSFTLDKKIDIDTFTGMCDGKDDVSEQFDTQLSALYEKYKDPNKLDLTLKKVKDDCKKYTNFITMHDNDKLLDSYVSKNLPFQVLYQTYVSRSFAWTQKSYRETGFREIQDIYASMYYMHANKQDELIKKLITSWVENVFEFGYAYHNFTSRGKEPGMCSDDQLWLIQAVYRYVSLTGDYDFLNKEIKIAGSDKKRPLYKTLEAIIIYSGKISVGKHNMPLLDTADWNDCLRLDKNVFDGPCKEELYRKQVSGNDTIEPLQNTQSESVMNACLLKIGADELCEMASKLKLEKIEGLCKEVSKTIYESMHENAWINGYFARCLINDDRGYKYLGSKGDGLSLDPNIDGTYYLNSYSWPLLADIATDQQIEEMLDVVDEYLKTPAGLKLVSPVDYDKLGIVTGSSFYFPGDRENGGVFKHAAMMATVASLKKAKTTKDEKLAKRLKDLAFFMIDKTLPYKTLNDPYVLKGNPRFCTQYNNSQTGEGIGPVLSGTASWLTLAVYEILGLCFNDETLKLNPIIDTDKFSYTVNLNDTPIDITVKAINDYRVNDKTKFIYDGNITTDTIVLPKDRQRHTIEVLL